MIERLAELSRRRRRARDRRRPRACCRSGSRRGPRFVHVVEVDASPRGRRCATALAPFSNAALHIGDALTIDLRALTPPPDKIVANLPYGIAATVILRTIDELPSVAEWVVMVQREVGERLRGGAGQRRLRGAVGARPARVRGQGAAPDRADRVPPGAERRLACCSGCAASDRPPIRRCSTFVHERSRTGARRSPGSLGARPATRRDRRPGGARRARSPGRRARRAAVAGGVQGAGTADRLMTRHPRARIREGQPLPAARRHPRRRPARAGDRVRIGLAGRRSRDRDSRSLRDGHGHLPRRRRPQPGRRSGH